MNQKGFKLDGFQIHLNKTDVDLTIEAENQTTMAQFFHQTTNGEVAELTHHLFTNIEELYEGIKTGLEQTTPEIIKISMTRSGELDYCYKIMIGKLERVFAFSLRLEEKSVTSNVKLERKMTQLTFRQEEHERVVLEKLENLDAKIKRLENLTEEKLKQYEKMMISKFQQFYLKAEISKTLQFDRHTKNKEKFEFTNHDERVTIKTSNTWYAAFSTEPLIKKNKQKFSVILEKCTHAPDGIMVGIAPGSSKNTDSCTSVAGSAFLYCYDGSVYTNGKNIKKEVDWKASEGSVIQVTINFNKNRIVFKADKLVVQKVYVDFATLKDVELYPCVNLYFKDDSVSFC